MDQNTIHDTGTAPEMILHTSILRLKQPQRNLFYFNSSGFRFQVKSLETETIFLKQTTKNIEYFCHNVLYYNVRVIIFVFAGIGISTLNTK